MWERRQHARHVLGSGSSVAQLQRSPGSSLPAEVRDISSGGLKADLSVPLAAGQVLRLELQLPGLAVRVPTLMQVRWCLTLPRIYRIGLKFIV